MNVRNRIGNLTQFVRQIIFIVIALFPAATYAQVGQSISLGSNCSYFGEKLPPSVATFDSDKEAEEVIRNIVSASGLVPNFEIRVGGVPNAAAVILQGKRFIVYDQYFIKKLTDSAHTKWAAISVMAHEVGHHLNGHTLDGLGSRPKTELEADYFSGFVLQKLGASVDDSRKAMEIFGSPTASTTHPAKHDRLAAITRGWTAACDKDNGCKEVGSKTSETKTSRDRDSTRTDRQTPTKPGPNSCEYANDGQCDEPDLCAPGTDTNDCRPSKTSRTRDRQSSPVYCCDIYGRKWCPIVAGNRAVGAPCFCQGVPGSGFICQ